MASFWTTPVIRDVERLGVKVVPLPKFVCGTVLPTIQEWKRNPPHRPRTTGQRVTLPESLWLLQMLDHMKGNRMLLEERPGSG